jgi:soluble lytic murein transglycosylase-like protein
LQVSGRIIMAVLMAGLLSGCAGTVSPQLSSILPHTETPQPMALAEIRPSPASPRAMDGLIAKYSAQYQVPESLIRRIIVRESGYNPKARNGPYYGLMQIRYDTAQSMGYRGPASGLLDADTNLQFGVKYLSGAYKVGGGNPDRAVSNYASGYYYAAKAKGLLEEVGLR